MHWYAWGLYARFSRPIPSPRTHPMGKSILSGGTTGPEGSIFILAILVLMTIIVLVTLPKRHYGRASNAMAAPIFDESR